MKILVIHGYLLDDSGSAIYVRELAKQFVKNGHEVTLICQEQNPQNHDFIDSYFTFDVKNENLSNVFERQKLHKGSCRMVAPNINKNLLIYFPGLFEGFNITTFQDANTEAVDSYLDANIKAVAKTLKLWPPDFIQANHLVMQPYIVNRAGSGKYPFAITIHGSALNFTVKKDPRTVPHAIEGLKNCKAVVSLGEASQKEIEKFAEEVKVNIADKSYVVVPGVDTDLFKPVKDREKVYRSLSNELRLTDDVLLFVGRLIWTKGIQYIIGALPLILQEMPNTKLVIAGDGEMKKPLMDLIGFIDAGRIDEARKFIKNNEVIEEVADYGKVIPELSDEAKNNYVKAGKDNIQKRVIFTGHLGHDKLSQLYGISDITVAPSVFPEAFGLICIEAISAGSLPVATYQSGFRRTIDFISKQIDEEKMKDLVAPTRLCERLAESCIFFLNEYPTKNKFFREKMHEIVINNFSWKETADNYIRLFQEY